jgi:hypothetical protein
MAETGASQTSGEGGASQPKGVVAASQVDGTVGARLAKPAANLWTPAQLPGLALWLDVWDSPFDLRDDPGGPYVTLWGDLSGNGNDATQTTGSEQPKLTDRVEFDGSQYLRSDFSPGIDLPIAKLALSDAAGNSPGVQWSTSDNTSNDGSIFTRVVQDKEETALYSAGAFRSIRAPSRSGPTLRGGQWQANGMWDLRVNGEVLGTRSATPTQNPLVVSSPGGLVREDSAGTNPGEFWVCVLVSANLTTEQWDKINGWLAWKAHRNGLPQPLQNLPSSHPFKSEPPKI